MELVGLEPTTSWVRFKSAAWRNPLYKRVSGQSSRTEPLGYPALVRGFWGWDPLHPQNEPRLRASRPCPGPRAAPSPQ